MLALRNRLIQLQGDFAARRHLRRSGWTSAEHDIIHYSFVVEGMKAKTAVIAFDLEGVAVSSGAA